MAKRGKVRCVAACVAAALFCCGIGPLLVLNACAQEYGVYEEFNKFCVENFGAEKEEEVYRMFGEDLKVMEGGSWNYISESSACIAWETNVPAKTYIEYGTSTAYGERTPHPERHFHIHIHYLKNLNPNATFHYRLVSVDERGNKVTTDDMTFSTRSMEDAVRIPHDLSGPPYTLDKANTTYLVTENITAGSTALNVATSGVTLDLGGHTIVYDEKAGSPDPSASERLYGWHAVQGPCGIRTADRRSGMTIVNGIIKQGKGNGTSRPAGYNPMFLRRPRDTEVAGVTVVYSGSQITGILIDSAYNGVHVHHNVVIDKGTKLYNRHRGLDGIYFDIERADTILKCHHNLIKRTRHRGMSVRSNHDIYSNEIYIDSYATNSYGIMYYGRGRNVALHHNRIFGAGYHPIGIGSGQGYSDVKVHANYIQMQGTRREERWTGGGGGGDPRAQLHPVNGIRLQCPGDNIEHYDNVVVIKGRGEGCMMRGLWLVPEDPAENISLRNNTVKLIAQDDKAEGYAIACCGAGEESRSSPITLEGNTLVTNLGHVQFGDNYGHGGLYHFLSNTFVKVGDDPRYRTIRLGWRGWKYGTFGHLFIDTEFRGGAGYGSVSFDGAGSGRYDFSVGWQLRIRITPGAMVSIKDKAGQEVFSGEVPQDGEISVPLIQYVQERDGKTMLTPHTVTIEKNGRAATREVTMDKEQEIRIRM